MDIPNIINHKGRYSRLADLIPQFVAEAETKPNNVDYCDLELAVIISMADSFERIAKSLEFIANKQTR